MESQLQHKGSGLVGRGKGRGPPTIKDRVSYSMNWSLTLAKVFVVLMLVVEMLGESTWGVADFPAGGDGIWPAHCWGHRACGG